MRFSTGSYLLLLNLANKKVISWLTRSKRFYFSVKIFLKKSFFLESTLKVKLGWALPMPLDRGTNFE